MVRKLERLSVSDPTEVTILVVGDIIGRPGREAAAALIPQLQQEFAVDFTIANGENSAHGKGITPATAQAIFEAGADAITTGNHVWDAKEVYNIIPTEPRLLRPANFSSDKRVPGAGHGIYPCPRRPEVSVAVLNLIGRVHMRNHDCPFRAADALLEELRTATPLVIVDFHAEATSEKIALGWYLDGRATCVFGTHTHVPTADERVLNAGTAYITDIGMTGGYEGVIGVEREPVLAGFLTNLPQKFDVAAHDVCLSGAVIRADAATGRARSIERIFRRFRD